MRTMTIAVLLAAAPALAQTAARTSTTPPANAGGMMHNTATNPYADAEMQMHDRMMKAEGRNAAESWTRKMIEHHRGAIEMSRIAVRDAKDPAVVAMARQTITKQQKEIDELNAMLKRQGMQPQM